MVRVMIKSVLKQFVLIPSYCKDCGCNIRDFKCDDKLWNEIMQEAADTTVCYNCFCDRAGTVFKISNM